jgi:hypothetical protein
MIRSRSTRRSLLSAALAAGCACGALTLFPGEAQARQMGEFDLGIDGDANALTSPSPSTNNLSTLGGGFKLRFGDRLRLRYGLVLTPEVGYAFDHVFPANSSNPDFTASEAWNMNRFFAGVRVGFGRYVVPTLYAHIGYGFRSVSTSGFSNAGTVAGGNGLALDTGIAVEFRLARHLSIGPHVEFTYIDVPSPPEWITFGGHVDFIF